MTTQGEPRPRAAGGCHNHFVKHFNVKKLKPQVKETQGPLCLLKWVKPNNAWCVLCSQSLNLYVKKERQVADLSALLTASKNLTSHLNRPDLPSVRLSLDQIEAQSRRVVSRQPATATDADRAYSSFSSYHTSIVD